MKFNDKKTLVAYFSRSGENYLSGNIKNLSVGNTETAAKIIADEIGCDSFKIGTVEKYSQNYRECVDKAREELKNNERPELEEHIDNINDYEVIFLGYPNWCGTCPMAVFTFLEEYDFTEKIIIPFCTHEGSGLGRSAKDIDEVSQAKEIKKGLAIHGTTVSSSKASIKDWIQIL